MYMYTRQPPVEAEAGGSISVQERERRTVYRYSRRQAMPACGVAAAYALITLFAITGAVQPDDATIGGGLYSEQRPVSGSVRQLSESLGTCTTDTVTEHITAVNQECCYAVDGTPLDCNAGPPVQCTASCARVFVPFWASECRSSFGTFDVQFNSFDAQCKSTHFDDEGGGSTGNSVLDPTLCHVQRSSDGDPLAVFNWIEISPLEMSECVGSTPAETLSLCNADNNKPSQRQGITASDIGTRILPTDWTSNGQNTWAGDDGWCVCF